MYVYMNVHMYASMCLCMYVSVCVCVCVYLCMYVCTYVYASVRSVFIVCVYMLVKVSTDELWDDNERGNQSTWAATYLYTNPT
jgi:hypothetical protein